MTRTADRRTKRTRTAAGHCGLERLELRRLLSTSPIDETFTAREPGVAFSTYAADVAVRDDGKVLVAESRRVGDLQRMAVSRFNADGSLDGTFGNGGRAYIDFGGTFASAEAMDVTADGHIVLAGAAGGDYAVARLNTDGSPDRSFGGDGTVTVDLGGQHERLLDVRVDAAGRVVATGNEAGAKLHLFRFTTAGAPDASFGGGDGEVQTALSAPAFRHVGAVLTLPDNRILVAGQVGGGARIQRFTTDGTVETTFAASAGGDPYDMALQADGKVVLGGIDSRFTLARYTTDGDLDPTFGTAGVVTTKLGSGGENVAGLAIQPDGRIVATGVAWQEADSRGYDFYTVRYLPSGTPDASFDGDGVVRTDVRFQSTDFAAAVAIAPGGKIVVAGDVEDIYAHVQTDALVRYNADGSPDAAFGGTGKVLGTFDGGYRRRINAVQRQPDGKVVAAGQQQVGLSFDFFVARYLADGRHDASFGDGGVAVTDFGGRGDQADTLLIQPDGRIVVGGHSDGPNVNNVPDDRFALARYTADGRLDPTFDGDGRVTTELGASYDEGVRDLDLYPGGRIVAVGHGGVARYNANGSPDTSFATDGTLNQPSYWGIAGAVSGDKTLYTNGGDVRRVNADGSSDPTFHFTPIPAPGSPLNDPEEGEPYISGADMQLAPDGRIIIAGTYHPNDYYNEITAFAVERYLPDGTPDTSFGTGGLTITDFPDVSREQVTALAIAPGGKPVLVGAGELPGTGGSGAVVARYTADGRLDGTFGYNGAAFADEGVLGASDVAVEPDGDVLVATASAVVRFHATARTGANLDRLSHTVFVTGTPGRDNILVDGTGGRLTVTVNGLRQSFSNRTFGEVDVYSAGGDDVITVRGGVFTKLFGGDGNDRLAGGPGAGALYGGAGDDTLDGGLGADELSGGEGTDTLDYSARTAPLLVRHTFQASGEDDERDTVYDDVEIVRGGSGDDRIDSFRAAYGNGGNDTLIADFYTPSALWGGDGDDLLIGGPRGDYFRGQAGVDTVTYGGRGAAVTVTIDGLANDGGPGENDNVYTDVENLVGGYGDDKLTGSAADNVLDGGDGDDDLRGGDGNDTLAGGAGKDQLRGQGGNDTLFADGDAGPDFLDGGPGTDRAKKDPNDFSQFVEEFLA